MSEFSDSEKFLRYLLLLGEGGSLVLRGVVLREVAKRRQILDVILSNSRELLSSKITNAHGYRRIYPNTSSVNADISTWDINLLAMVIIHLFGNTLEQVQLNWITEIQSTRESITAGDTKHVTLEEEEYRKNRLRLSLNLLNLAAETDFNTHYLCLDVISKSGVVPYDVQTLLQKVSEIHEYPSDMIHNLQKQLEEETEVDERTGHNSSYIRERSCSMSYKKMGERLTDLHTQNWYFGPLTRDETMEIFRNVEADGVFLVRDCTSDAGSYVLCVQEGGSLSRYLIRRVQEDNGIKYHIGEKDTPFDNVPSIIEFYSSHYLNKTPLMDPAPRQKVVTTSDFQGTNQKDLPFTKGETLEIISKGEERWWYAKNADGRIGIVPVLYISPIQKENSHVQQRAPEVAPKPKKATHRDESPPPSVPKRLPSKAIVTKARISNPYDKTQLTLHEGDIVLVTKMFANGQWHGECNGKSGKFPNRYVTFLDDM